ncbi:hypothetical protein C0992_007251 [Termitomyces sp. T32_za158]|nr:hypothetical protein C0992_007251 [Termitomyces sp. T32_za158]
MDARLRRVNKEISDCKNDKTSNIKIDLIDDNPFHLKGSFPGPDGTPYEGGTFEVDIAIPEGYPFQPVKMKFITKVYHPNVSSASGAICLDILKDACLLCSPEPNDPQDAEVAKHFTTSKNSFDTTATYWTQMYAGGPGPKGGKANVQNEIALAGLESSDVEQFTSLGFDKRKVIDVLRRLNYRGANVAKITEDRVVEELLR